MQFCHRSMQRTGWGSNGIRICMAMVQALPSPMYKNPLLSSLWIMHQLGSRVLSWLAVMPSCLYISTKFIEPASERCGSNFLVKKKIAIDASSWRWSPRVHAVLIMIYGHEENIILIKKEQERKISSFAMQSVFYYTSIITPVHEHEVFRSHLKATS